jgi:hypothetical protein
LTTRTLAHWLARKQPLTTRELAVLNQLDARDVSRFAGRILHTIDDQPMQARRSDSSPAIRPAAGAQFSHHMAICGLLATRGTREAIPGLLDAIKSNRFRSAELQPPLDLPRIAALAIALRDPWPGVDAWLAGLVERDDPLVAGQTDAPQLGATAAAVLLERHGELPSAFGLESTGQQGLAGLAIAGYRFATGDRQQIKTWLEEKSRDSGGPVGPESSDAAVD